MNAYSVKHAARDVRTGVKSTAGYGRAVRETAPLAPAAGVGRRLHMRSSMEGNRLLTLRVQRRCLVCEYIDEQWEDPATDEIGPPCARCHAPTERVQILERRRAAANPHAAALGRLGGLKGGPARAARLSARRRREIARTAARARWSRPREE